MKKYMIVNSASLIKLMHCFATPEEFNEFATQLSDMMNEIDYTRLTALRSLDNQEFVSLMILKQYFVFAVFCRQNIEIIKELINKIEYTEIDETERNRLVNNPPTEET